METKSILFKPIPAWYNIVWGSADHLFHIEIHKEAIVQLPILRRDMPLIQSITEEFGFGNELFDTFCGDLSKGKFGFNDQIRLVAEQDQFLDFAIKPPTIRIISHEACEHCGDSGKDENTGTGRCLYCEGRGRKMEWDWREAHLANVSLALLLFILDTPPEVDTSSTYDQIATVETGWARERHFISGHISKKAFEVLKRGAQKFVPKAKKAMIEADAMMMGKINFHDDYSFRARIDDNFILECPGQACGVYTTDGARRDLSSLRAIDYHCHNVDSPIQTLTLLAGLSAFFGGVRQSFIPKVHSKPVSV